MGGLQGGAGGFLRRGRSVCFNRFFVLCLHTLLRLGTVAFAWQPCGAGSSLDVDAVAHGAAQQATFELVLPIGVAGKPAFKAVAVVAVQIKNFHGRFWGAMVIFWGFLRGLGRMLAVRRADLGVGASHTPDTSLGTFGRG